MQFYQLEASVNSEPSKNDEKIRLSALRQEKRTLQARITKIKKEVAKLRAKKRDQEFSSLQNPQQYTIRQTFDSTYFVNIIFTELRNEISSGKIMWKHGLNIRELP
jgi:hypothetical protein